MPKITADVDRETYDILKLNGKRNGRKLSPEVRFALEDWCGQIKAKEKKAK